MSKKTELNELYVRLDFIAQSLAIAITSALNTRYSLRQDARGEVDFITNELFYLRDAYFASCNDPDDISSNVAKLTDDIMFALKTSDADDEVVALIRHVLAEWFNEMIDEM